MNGKIINPPNYEDADGPIIFLAGPIQGAEWQSRAIEILQRIAPHLHIASPRRDYFDEEFHYEAQVNWETYFLRQAGATGAVMFWLAREVTHRCDRAFAQTTRFELGEWKVRHERDGVKLIIGIEEGFTNSRYIRLRMAQDCPGVKICDSLEQTCQQSVQEIFTTAAGF